MNMSDDVTGVTLSIVQKGADVAAHTAKEFIDLLVRLFVELGRERERSKANAANSSASSKPEKPSVKSTNLTDIKPGIVDKKKLDENARAIGDTVSMSENALTQEDKQFIAKKAKAYGIPVAFSNEKSKNHVFARVRTSDLPLFKQICTEMMQSKIAEHPQKLGNFNCKAWEIPFLTEHLKKRDLAAQFIQTSGGKNLCVFDIKQKSTFQEVYDDFTAQCIEVKKDLSFDREEAGFITIRNQRTGKDISFDVLPDKKSLAAKMEEAFGYDEIKAKIAAARFGEEMLQGKAKKDYFEDSAQRECIQVESNVFLTKEDSQGNEINIDPLPCRAYECWRVIPKSDERPRLIYRNDDGEFAILEPTKMTRVQMRHALKEQLGVTDRQTQDALIFKAECIESHYAQKEAHTAEYTFSKDDFDLTDVRYTMGLRKTDEQGNTIYTKQLPISSMSSEINRTEKDFFRVDSTVTSVEKDANGVDHKRHDTQHLVLSFSDKKSSLQQLREMYVAQGVPDHVAKKMAKDVFRNAELQNPDKTIQIQEVREKAMTVAYGTHTAEVSMSDKKAAADRIIETFGVPAETADIIVEKAAEIKEKPLEVTAVSPEQIKPAQTATPEEQAEKKKRITAFSQAANISEEQAERILQKAKEQAQIGDADENVGFHTVMGDVYLGTQENFTASVAESLGVTTEEADQIIESADTNYLNMPDETLTAETKLAAEIGGNGHEAHPDGNILARAAAGIGGSKAPEVDIPKVPLPELPPPTMGVR